MSQAYGRALPRGGQAAAQHGTPSSPVRKSFLVIVRLYRFEKQAGFACCIGTEDASPPSQPRVRIRATKCLTCTQGALLALASERARHGQLTGPFPWVTTCNETNLRFLDCYLPIGRHDICLPVNQGDFMWPSRYASFGSKLSVTGFIISTTQRSHDKAQTGQLSASIWLCRRDSPNTMRRTVDEAAHNPTPSKVRWSRSNRLLRDTGVNIHACLDFNPPRTPGKVHWLAPLKACTTSFLPQLLAG